MDLPASNSRPPFFKQNWVFPFLLALLLLPVLILLPWQSQKIEFQDHEQQLIADTLWVEQGIRFQLIRNEENLVSLGDTIVAKSAPAEKLKERIFELSQDHSELHQLIWVDASNQVLFSKHPLTTSDLSSYLTKTAENARSSRDPRYSQPYEQEGEKQVYLMDYYLPLFRNYEYIGSLVASYKISTILDQMVPWWFAKDNETSLTNFSGVTLAQRADGGYGHNIYTHAQNLDLPGVHLVLKTNSFKDAPQLLSNYLVAAVVALTLGLLWCVWALWHDILRRQAAETALRKQIAFRSAMEKSLVTGLRVRSLDGCLVYVNPAFCEMVGYTVEQLIGQKIPLPFWTEEIVESFQQRTLIAGKNSTLNGLESMYIHSSGRRIPVLIYESPLVDEDGIQTGWMASILDISEQKKAEQILRQHEEKLQSSARLSTMGELASVMAHELNQPLAAISSYATGALNMMKSGNLDQEMLQPALVQMQNQAQRAGQIIRSVHDFVAKREPNRTKQQFKDIFKSILPLIELQAKSYLVSLQLNIEDSLPAIFVDSTSFEQVILNLTRNALQSMQELTLQQRILQIDAKNCGSYVQIDVIDHGTGLSQEVIERLFSPFFSTKAEGMGMGLNICRTIIEFHGGQLAYRANPVGGTIFSFTLPVVENEADLKPTSFNADFK
ncbi:MAG: sensor histidine kinase [Solimicrobium sp.]|nr:sensor histidine kinase [Solimicrobium sp.]